MYRSALHIDYLSLQTETVLNILILLKIRGNNPLCVCRVRTCNKAWHTVGIQVVIVFTIFCCSSKILAAASLCRFLWCFLPSTPGPGEPSWLLRLWEQLPAKYWQLWKGYVHQKFTYWDDSLEMVNNGGILFVTMDIYIHNEWYPIASTCDKIIWVDEFKKWKDTGDK